MERDVLGVHIYCWRTGECNIVPLEHFTSSLHAGGSSGSLLRPATLVHVGSLVRYHRWKMELSTLLMSDHESRHSSSRLLPCSPSRLLRVVSSCHRWDSRPYSVDVASSCSVFASFTVANFRVIERSQFSFGICWCLLSGLQILFSGRYMRLSRRSMATCRQI